ncbi:MAG: 5-(carboxyamino)imidazole ribonucleotide mutase [Candidatus Omnitrophica bacterium CG11_big_fil_rev_8_21_14_0_20_45_26]|uniref:N5-carboxyaminoimidazole ribonucleotide mutase n=1 Tax=Candidatus Abzuiibacterium crystallinum TaxID=1974748 RepID=A0A2H0LP23_9BACT|nr:MAG: 5-(carboxyamino)imidazole ribonucleotide mutase [Candidatus Omnitrophica bacterium CG11_big_fil_rev_8_21_14_0_20_45_26]PIW65258.1 MAG: 5-(carboxyamino)imidazole ribonucleotide mutase [Candidatus Omnitrophica bacterium CG12_big_fil_rev_8_21_14_0_65_45_16]
MSMTVAILMGSDSDLDIMQEAAGALEKFGISYEMKVLSAHRSPADLIRYVENTEKKGVKVYIAGAGGAAHLAGVIAAHTTRPVIGVPIPTAMMGGLDSLLATVQMPSGIPVATVAASKGGAANAGILAAQILALSDTKLQKKMAQHKTDLAKSVQAKNEKLAAKLKSKKA